MVSIHLMLLFIPSRHTNNCKNFRFNTSHVTLYQFVLIHQGELLSGFNTSHVTLYRSCGRGSTSSYTFQYISCYSLSVSHIFVVGTEWKFQYISCYSLSIAKLSCKYYTIQFQYISCYSLSLVFPIFSLLTFFIISQNTRVCNIFPKQHRLFESFHRSTPKPYIFTTFHIFL